MLDYNLEDVIPSLLEFRKERDWDQFHRPKELAAALSIEASELQELFLWKDQETVNDVLIDEGRMKRIKEEVADIGIFLIYFTHDLNINLKQAIEEKLELNRKKYPQSEYRGLANKSRVNL